MKINREILRLSIPAIVSNITVPLLGLCDTGISGHLGSEKYLAAIAVGSMMINVVVWLFGFLRMGTTGITANAFGQGNDFEIRRSRSASLLLANLLGLLLFAFRGPIVRFLLVIVSPESEVATLAGEYFKICVSAAPALLATMAISGWFVGMQSTAWPMVIAISVNIINMIVSFSLVFVFDMGFYGVAWGTFTANWTGVLLALFAVWRSRKGKRLFTDGSSLLHRDVIKRFFTVNSNLFLRSACVISVSLGVTASGARMGSMTLAINAVMMQFFTLFSFFMDGFAFSAEALTGRWLGASDPVMLRRSVRSLLVWAAGVAILFTLVYVSGYTLLSTLLTDDEAVIRGVVSMRVWLWLIPIVSVWAFIYDGFYVGITDTGRMLLATFLATAAFFIGAFVIPELSERQTMPESNGILWSAFLAYLLIRGVVLAIMWPGRLHRSLASVK